jgi:large subunit ribosomal protein L25
MAKIITLEAQSRQGSGSSAARRLRRAGWLPAVIGMQGGNCSTIQLNAHGFEMMLRHHTGENLIVDMVVDGGSPCKALLKEVQHDPLDDHPVHADFLEISMTEKLTVRIAIVVTGEPVGVTQEGGVLEQHMRELEVECLPTDIVEQLTVDVSGLSIGHSVRVKDMQVDPKLTVLTPPELAVASVLAPRLEEEEVPAEAAEGAEPEVIGAKKEEGEAAEGEEAKGKPEKGAKAEKGEKAEKPEKPEKAEKAGKGKEGKEAKGKG